MATFSVDGWALKKVVLDTADQYVPDVLIANEGDADGSGIDLYITSGGVAAAMTGATAYLAWGHENGNQGLTKFAAVSAATGHFKVYYPPAMLHKGTVLARIAVYVGAKTPITGSRDFRILIERNPIDEDRAITTEDFTVFKRAVVDLNTATANADKSTKAANDAAKKATDAAADANAAKENADKAATSANSAAKNADEQAGWASNAAGDADAATVKAKTATSNAEKATTEAAAATRSATNAASQAQGAASNANAAASNALQIANSIASNGAGDGEVAALKESVDKLGNLAAELSGGYVVMDGTLYSPTAKASANGATATLKSASVSGEMASLN